MSEVLEFRYTSLPKFQHLIGFNIGINVRYKIYSQRCESDCPVSGVELFGGIDLFGWPLCNEQNKFSRTSLQFNLLHSLKLSRSSGKTY